MTETEFKSELKGLNGGYLFFGGEDYLKYSYSKEVEKNVLDGTFDEFNHIVIYAEEYSASVLSNAISSLPMMAEKKLVEVRGVNFTALKKNELDELDSVLSTLKDNSHTVLLIRADNEYFNPGRLPKNPSELYKIMTKHLTPVEFEFPGPARLKSWILRHFKNGGIEFPPELCDEIVNVCGHDMWALSNEIDKLCAYASYNSKKAIDKGDIDAVCCKTIEYDDFQLTNALLAKNKSLVFETLRRQKSAFDPPITIMASIIRMYSDLLLVEKLYSEGMNKSSISSTLGIHEFKVGKYISAVSGENPKKLKRAVELCRDADIASKSSSNVTGYIALERLVSALCALFCR